MGLTKTKIPIPSSDYLLTESDLTDWSPIVYKTGEDIKKAIRVSRPLSTIILRA